MATNNSINNSTLVTTYNSSDTWNKNSRSQFIEVYIFQGGGGGASGRKGVSTTSGGGGGGSGCGGIRFASPATSFGNSETVTVGASANGGGAQASDLTNGINGTAANSSTFGNINTGINSASNGGTTSTATGGIASINSVQYQYATIVSVAGITGGTGNIVGGSTPVSVTSGIYLVCTPGGGGAGYDLVTVRAGGAGGTINKFTGAADPLILGGTAGTESGTINGGDGNPTPTSGGLLTGGTGGGGGGGPKAGTTVGNGGNGGSPGGGGGGGSGGISTVSSSGAGGTGSAGRIIVIEHF
jgi:hypothetical protein